MGATPVCRDPWCVPQVTGFPQPPVQIEAAEKGDLLSL